MQPPLHDRAGCRRVVKVAFAKEGAVETAAGIAVVASGQDLGARP